MHANLALLLPIFCALASTVTGIPVHEDGHLEARATTSIRTLALGRAPRSSTTSKTSTTTRVTTTARTSTTTTKATTTTTRATSSSSSAAPVATGDAVPDAWSQGILSAHNSARSTHGANPLVWSTELTTAAKNWAEKCVWQHGGTSGISGGAGQNLAAAGSSGTTASQSGQAVVDAWMSEEKDYNPSNPTYSHFTQVVWKNTQELGCYQAPCAGSKFVNPDGSTVFPSNIKSVVYTVCNYRKPGNYAGQYAMNVSKNQ